MLNVLLPSLYFGLPVVAHRERGFDPERFMHLVGAHGIKNVFMPPTALKLLRSHFQGPVEGVALRSIGSGGETLGAGLLEWGRRVFGVGINEFYGQTELNLVVGNNAAAFPCRPGSMGVAKPGHEVAGYVSLKHVHAIAEVKRQDPGLRHLPLRSICSQIVATAKSMGIEVVPRPEDAP